MRKTILLAGGGTLGPVTPLLAVARQIHEKHPEWLFAWAGTDTGPERSLVEAVGIPFTPIKVAKLPRYLSLELLMAPFNYLRARQEAGRMLDEVKPSLVLTAGGFTAVPVILEAASRRIPCFAHQLDYVVGMSNRLVAKHCRYVTTSFEYPTDPFGTKVVTYHVPTPCRFTLKDLPSRDAACRYFELDPARPVLFVTGGGTGAKTLNEAMSQIQKELPAEIQVIHVVGKGKREGIVSESRGYVVHEFFGRDEMLMAYAAADLVVSRAGVGAISELAALKKTAILVALPDSPQELNVAALRDAVVRINHSHQLVRELKEQILSLLQDETERSRLGQTLHEVFPTDQGEALASLALSVLF